MSFCDIKDPRKRDNMINDYLAIKERLKKSNLDERAQNSEDLRQREKEYAPVIASNKEMAETITKELGPLQKSLGDLTTLLEKRNDIPLELRQIIGVKRKTSDAADGGAQDEAEEPTFGPHAKMFLNGLVDENQKKMMDCTFGIRKDGDSWKIGNKTVTLDPDDSIYVGDRKFPSTRGFWALVTLKYPGQMYTAHDLGRYKELLYETSALNQDYDPSSPYPRANRSKKWKKILAPIWQEFKENGIVEDPDDSTDFSDAEGEGLKMYLRSNGKCYNLLKTADGAMHISPRPAMSDVYSDGLYLRRRNTSRMFRGEGLILGPNSPFKNIPILQWLL